MDILESVFETVSDALGDFDYSAILNYAADLISELIGYFISLF